MFGWLFFWSFQVDLLSSRLRTFQDDHLEEVQASRFQVMEQVLAGLQPCFVFQL